MNTSPINHRICGLLWCALVATLLAGCASIPAEGDRPVATTLARPGQQAETTAGVVHVGGDVVEPGILELPASGLTLGQAMVQVNVKPYDFKQVQVSPDVDPHVIYSKAGANAALTVGKGNEFQAALTAARADFLDASDSELRGFIVGIAKKNLLLSGDTLQQFTSTLDSLTSQTKDFNEELENAIAFEQLQFVMLERRSRAIQQTFYYFPLDDVRDNVAGQISLRDGDVLRVVSATDTGLPDFPSNVDGNFVVAGLVANPATLSVLDNPTLANVNGDISATHLMISRPSTSGLVTQQFVLDLHSELTNQLLGIIAIHPGDQLIYTQLDSVPIVRGGLLNAVQQAQASQTSSTRRGTVFSGRSGAVTVLGSSLRNSQGLRNQLSRFR